MKAEKMKTEMEKVSAKLYMREGSEGEIVEERGGGKETERECRT